MKYVLLFCLLSCSAVVSAQTWSVLNDQFLDLYNKGEFDKAVEIGEKAKVAAQKEFGVLHANYATSLYNLASVYAEKENYKKAEPLYLQAKSIQQKVLGELSADYSSTISDLATLYFETKQYSRAEPLYLQAKKISEQTNDTANAEYFIVVDNLAALYDEMKLYEKAEPLYLRSNKFYKENPGENNTDYESSLNNLATLYDKTSRYEDAQTYYWLLADLYKQKKDDSSQEYATVINRLALNYTSMGEYEKAGPLYFQNATIRKKLYGENHPDYASALNNIASHYIDLGQYEKAIPYYQEAIDIAEEHIQSGNTDYMTYVNNFALLYMLMGKYDIAEPLLVKLAEVRKKIIGENDPSYATSLNNLAVIYFKTGQYDKAIPIYISSLAIIKRTIGEQTADYASTLNNLGLVYASMGQLSKAGPLYLLAKTIREKIKGQNHPDYAALLDNLAQLYAATDQDAKAKTFYQQAASIRQKLFGEMHPDYAVSLNNLAYYYMDISRYDSAEILFKKASDIMRKVLGEEHPSYGTAINNLSDLYIRTAQYEKASPGLLQSAKIIIQNIRGAFNVLSETEKNNYLEANKAVFETAGSFLFRYKKASGEILTSSYNLQLALKSASLLDTKNMMDQLLNSPDSNIRKLFSSWTVNRNLLAKQFSLPENSRRKDLAVIENDTEKQEKELNLLSSEFRGQQSSLQIVSTDIQQKLEADEVALEFIRFKLTGTDSILYAAYILHKNSAAPEFVPLCEEKQLQELFDSAGKNSTSMVSSFYRGLDTRSKTAGLAGKELYKLIWQPLEPFLKGIAKISYAPAGKLYSLAFHAIPIDSNTILADRYQLHQYISTRQVALRTKEDHATKPAGISLFGNARFTMDSLELVKQKDNLLDGSSFSTSVYFPVRQNRGNGVWNDLPGTGEEVNKISNLFEQQHIKTILFTGYDASEEKLKMLSGHSPQLLHIATHGFFLPEPVNKKTVSQGAGSNSFTLANNSLLRSGLVLAGGNYAWSGKKPIDGVEDGIVTAYEISQLNLSNTELVVLSACETALGDVKGSEGVFGLQRSFKMAGVKKMIVSLWQVPDRETAELMINFYTYCLEGRSTSEAFSAAQAGMRKKYPAYYWAAFVLVE